MTDKTISYPDEVMELARDVAREAGQRYILAGPMGFIDPVARAIMLYHSRRDPGLTAEVERLRTALREIAHPDETRPLWSIARAALGEA